MGRWAGAAAFEGRGRTPAVVHCAAFAPRFTPTGVWRLFFTHRNIPVNIASQTYTRNCGASALHVVMQCENCMTWQLLSLSKILDHYP